MPSVPNDFRLQHHSATYELLDRRSRFARILVLPDPDHEPARRGEPAVAVAAGDATELQTPPLGVGLGQMGVFRAGVPEAPVDEHRDPRAAQQDVGTPTAITARHGPVDDEPHTAPVQSTTQCQFRSGPGSPGPTHHP